MLTQEVENKKDFILSFYCLYIIFMAAACSDFFISVTSQVVFLVFSILMIVRSRVNWLQDRLGWILLFSFLGMVFLHYMISNVFMLGSVKFFAVLLAVYHIVNAYRMRFLNRLMDCIYVLSLITVPFYILQLLNVELLRSLLMPFNFSFTNQSSVGGVYVFLFNVSPAAWGELYRNSGFMWEPGAFGGMLVFAMTYFYYKNGFKTNKQILFLMVYALTTVSTATIFALFFFISLLIFSKYRNRSYLIIAILPVLVAVSLEVYALPFMGAKIDYYFETNLDYKIAYQFGSFDQGGTSIGRFSGFMIEFDRLKASPLIGHGWDSDYSELGIGNEWSNPSGLSVLMGKFGAVGLVFVVLGLINFSRQENKISFYQKLLFSLVILVPVFSNPFQINIVFWAFVMFGIVRLKKIEGAPKLIV